MGRPAETQMATAGLRPKREKARVDEIEVTQAVQNLDDTVPLVARKRTLVRVYLGLESGALNVEGELRIARTPFGPWLAVASTGPAQLDVSRSGSSLAQLTARRNQLAYSLNFRVPLKFTRAGNLWVRLRKVREAGSGQPVWLSDPVGSKRVQFEQSPSLRLRVINLRYSAGNPPTSFAALAGDLEHLRSWLRRAYPVPDLVFSSVTIDATAAWPFTSGQANAQLAAIRALDMASGGDARTHYYGMVSDGGGFMRGSASGIPGSPDPATVASGPTGSNTWGWDNDGSYGDWYGGHELGHTFGRFHPGFCNQTHDDNSYPFANGQLADADDAFVGLDLGDSALGVAPAALPGTIWHDVMTYCASQWLSSYTYTGIRERLADEDAAFGGAQPAGAIMGDPLVHVAGVVNLTQGSASIEHVTPLPGPAVPTPEAADARAELRVVEGDGEARMHPVELKVDLCRLPDEDETAIVDAILDVPEDTKAVELLIDGDVLATFEVGPAPEAPPQNVTLTPPSAEGLRAGEPSDETGWTLSWDDGGGARGAGLGSERYVVQASTDEGRTWMTLAVGAQRTAVDVDPSELGEDASHVRFRVLSTNGVSYSETSTEDVPLEED
jgi:hypothetical protein